MKSMLYTQSSFLLLVHFNGFSKVSTGGQMILLENFIVASIMVRFLSGAGELQLAGKAFPQCKAMGVIFSAHPPRRVMVI